MRQALVKAGRRLQQQVAAVERTVARQAAHGPSSGGIVPADAIAALATIPLAAALQPVEKQRKALDLRLTKLAKKLPAWPWVESVRGFGALTLAAITGEAGDLSVYANPGKLWKRMGLAVFDGQRQRLVPGEAALLHGYSPERRAVMWNLGESIVKCNGDGEYRRLYLERKAYELARAPEMKPAQAHARAKRFVEKRLAKHTWQAHRGVRAPGDFGELDTRANDLAAPLHAAPESPLAPAIHVPLPSEVVPGQAPPEPADPHAATIEVEPARDLE